MLHIHCENLAGWLSDLAALSYCKITKNLRYQINAVQQKYNICL